MERETEQIGLSTLILRSSILYLRVDGPIHYPHARPANIVLVEVPIWLSVIYHLHYWTKTVSCIHGVSEHLKTIQRPKIVLPWG